MLSVVVAMAAASLGVVTWAAWQGLSWAVMMTAVVPVRVRVPVLEVHERK